MNKESKTIVVDAGVRYWEDASFNGVYDTEDGKLVPLRDGDSWKLEIDINTGKIKDWPQGTEARIHYKVCDAGIYKILDQDRKVILELEGYVPDFLDITGDSFGDYLIFLIDTEGVISGVDDYGIVFQWDKAWARQQIKKYEVR